MIILCLHKLIDVCYLFLAPLGGNKIQTNLVGFNAFTTFWIKMLGKPAVLVPTIQSLFAMTITSQPTSTFANYICCAINKMLWIFVLCGKVANLQTSSKDRLPSSKSNHQFCGFIFPNHFLVIQFIIGLFFFYITKHFDFMPDKNLPIKALLAAISCAFYGKLWCKET